MKLASTSHWTPGRMGHVPRAIVVHTTAGTAASALHWFAAEESGVSAHYLVDLNGSVTALVDEGDTARHAGRVRNPTWTGLTDATDPNLFTIGIEFEDGGDPEDPERTPEQYDAGAALIASVALRWGIPIDDDHVIGHRMINGSKSCPGALAIGRLIAGATEFASRCAAIRGRNRAHRSAGPRLVCLMPVRNGTPHLAPALDSIAPIADGVVVLDDGSTDDSVAIASSHPAVDLVLRNPARSSYAGWHDGANRNRLLQAAAELDPDWVLFFDADESISRTQAALLRHSIDDGLSTECAYGFRLRTAWMGGHDPQTPWVYRLFAPRPDDVLPTRRLHFTPVPHRIPSERWERLPVVVDHLGLRTPEDLTESSAKYRQADPSGRYSAGAASPVRSESAPRNRR